MNFTGFSALALIDLYINVANANASNGIRAISKKVQRLLL
jgi:hypothetical protein